MRSGKPLAASHLYHHPPTTYSRSPSNMTEQSQNQAGTELPPSVVLIVDDNPQNVELLQAFLEAMPVKIVTATDGQEALDKVQEHNPDLILLDIMMPRMSGFQVCKKLKSDPNTKDIQILMVTALNELGDIEQATECGTDDFVSKPVNKFELLTRQKPVESSPSQKRTGACVGIFKRNRAGQRRRRALTTACGLARFYSDFFYDQHQSSYIVHSSSRHFYPSHPSHLRTIPACIPTCRTSPPQRNSPSLGQVHYQQANQRGEVVCVLQNGMTVICKRISSPVLAVRVRVGTGGIYEGRWLGGGLSHLLEHLVAGGSSEPPHRRKNKELLQKIGNNSNAFTTENHTDFFIDTTPDHLDESVDLLSGWVLGALITPNEYRREYQVVQRELEMGKGEPDRQFWYLSQMNRYRVSPAQYPVIGYQEVIQGLSRDDVYNYYKMAYVPQNMIFSIAGDLDPQVMLAAVQKYVGDAKPGRIFEHNISTEPAITAPRSVMATFPKLGQAQLGLSYPSVHMNDADMYPLDLLATMLGDGDSSVFVEELRDKQQLVSSVGAEDDTPSYDRGSFGVMMQLDPTKIPAATAAVKQIIEQIKTKGVTAEQLDRAKTQVRVAHARAADRRIGSRDIGG